MLDRLGYAPSLLEVIIDHHVATGGQLAIIVDVGCGTGQATLDLAHYLPKAIGLDPSNGMLKRPRAAAESAGSPVRFEVSAAENIGVDIVSPIAESSIDPLSAAAAAHWFDLPRFWSSAARVLKLGGTFALWARTGMSIDAPRCRTERLSRRFWMRSTVSCCHTNDRAVLYREIPMSTYNSPGPPKTHLWHFTSTASFVKMWNKHSEWEPAVQGEDAGTQRITTPMELEKLLGTQCSVAGRIEAHPHLAGTDIDIVRNLRQEIEGLLHDVNVQPGEEILRVSLAIVLYYIT